MYDLFIENCIDAVKELLNEDYQVELQSVTKNNGVTLDAIIIKPIDFEQGAIPMIYLMPYYNEWQHGRSIPQIAESIVIVYRNYSRTSFDGNSILDFQKIKGKICFKLINTKCNKDFLKTVPHRSFHDLSVVYYVFLDDFEGYFCSMLIHNALLETWGVTEKNLYECAFHNTYELFPFSIKSFQDICEELLEHIADKTSTEEILDKIMGSDMYTLCSDRKCMGACGILYKELLKEFAEEKKSDLWLIPSSIHEWIIIPSNRGIPADVLTDMICSVNFGEVAREEVLSNHPYLYSRHAETIISVTGEE